MKVLVGVKPGYSYQHVNMDNKHRPYYYPTNTGWIEIHDWIKILRFEAFDFNTLNLIKTIKELKYHPLYKELEELISWQKSELYQFNIKSLFGKHYIRHISVLGEKRHKEISIVDLIFRIPYYKLLCKYYNWHIGKYQKESKYWV